MSDSNRAFHRLALRKKIICRSKVNDSPTKIGIPSIRARLARRSGQGGSNGPPFEVAIGE